jgi:lysophospholipase L1-like esterase
MSASRTSALLRTILVPIFIAIALLFLVEGAWRVVGRIRTKAWPQTRAVAAARFVESVGKAYERHPFFVVSGRPGGGFDLAGHKVEFDERGYRKPAAAGPKGTKFRVVCIGGSTTFDLLAATGDDTWPARLAQILGPDYEVVNAGFPGWTTAESLIALELRDVDLAPDLIVSFAGLNDLQPGSHRPFRRDYAKGHGEVLPRILGVDRIPVALASRFVFVEWLLDRMEPAREEVGGYSPVFNWSGGDRAAKLPDEAVAVFARNLRSTVGVARVHGAATLLVAQQIRLRQGRPDDHGYIASWVPGLTPEAIVDGLARNNAAAAAIGTTSGARFFDPFAAGAFRDADFADPFHFSAAGSQKMAESLAPVVREIRESRPR